MTTRAERIKKKSRHFVSYGEGDDKLEFEMVPPDPMVLVELGFDPACFDIRTKRQERSTLIKRELEKRRDMDLTDRVRFQNELVQACVIDPKIVLDGSAYEVAEDEVHIRDLGIYADLLFVEALMIGGFVEAEAAADAARTFRREALGLDDNEGGDPVRSPALDDAEGESAGSDAGSVPNESLSRVAGGGATETP